MAVEDLRERLPQMTLDELVQLSTLDRAAFPKHVEIVEDELVRRGVTALSSKGRTVNLSERHPKKRWFAWVTPTIDTETSALRVARQGALAAWIVAGTTALFSLIAFWSKTFASAGFGVGALLEAGIFVWFGFQIWKGSPAFAIVALILYVLERAYGWVTIGRFPGGIAVFLCIAFINGFRGTQALREFRAKNVHEDI